MTAGMLPLSLVLAQLPLLAPLTGQAQAGLLGLIRPQVEAQMARECQKALGKAEGGLSALSRLCDDIARPASVCVVQEIERNGNLPQVAGEALSGRLGPASLSLATTCVGRLLDSARPGWDQAFPVR
jgi:hypothetical protein